MTNRWPDEKLEREMLADADLNTDGGCHIRALLGRVRELEDTIVSLEKRNQQELEMVETLAAAGARLTSLAGGGEVEDGDVFFASNEGKFSEQIAGCRIRWLLKCEKAIKSMADQICSPKTTPEDMVADILGEPRKTKKASR